MEPSAAYTTNHYSARLRIACVLLLVAALSALSGCSQPEPATGPSLAPPAGPVGPGPESSHGSNERQDSLADARSVFATKCVACHGADGTGDPHFSQIGIPNFTDPKWQARASDAEMEKTIRTGKGKFMPAWEGKLSDAEIASLVRFIRTFPEHGPKVADGVQSKAAPTNRP